MTNALLAELIPVQRLTKDTIKATQTLGPAEARFLVDLYYQMQGNRIVAGNQTKALEKTKEPNAVIAWLADQNEVLEGQIKRAMDKYTDASAIGQWVKSICGIGPVIAGGLIAHIDITRAPTVGHIWSYAGMEPGQKRTKGEKIKWNPALKRLAWIAGESFNKTSGNDKDIYGKLIIERKAYETAKNEAGDYSAQAADMLASKKFTDKTTEAYKAYTQGKLPLGHVHARAKRYAVKLFLSNLHTVWYWMEYGKLSPAPFAMTHRGHVHYVMPPHLESVEGLEKALRKEYKI